MSTYAGRHSALPADRAAIPQADAVFWTLPRQAFISGTVSDILSRFSDIVSRLSDILSPDISTRLTDILSPDTFNPDIYRGVCNGGCNGCNGGG